MEKAIKIVLCFTIFFGLDCSPVLGQGINNNWLTGYSSLSGLPEHNVSLINYFTGSATISLNPMEMEFRQTHANISDKNGDLLFYTNGYYIADVTGDTMMNGSGINPSNFTNTWYDGLTLPHPNVIIPNPIDSNKYYFVHSTIDTTDNMGFPWAKKLYMSQIDMTLNSNLGGVSSKNIELIQSDLIYGRVNATRHGNGRDWWIIVSAVFTNEYHKFLLDDSGINIHSKQSIGNIKIPSYGQSGFSQDGSKYFYIYESGTFELFDFDRCTGLLSNYNFIDINTSATSVGGTFSQNGKIFYLSATDSLFQFDLMASNILSTKTTVAVWDSFYSSPAQLPTYFQLMALAPNGKIYITTGNSTFHYHIIDQPDSLGTACNVIQHGLNLNHYYFNTLPNHPNYHLGPWVGSACDTIITGIPPPKENLTLKLYPNPNSGTFQITYTPLPENLTLQVFNILGEEVHRQLLPQWSQLQNINLSYLNSGIYFAKLSSTASSTSLKFLVE